MPAGTAAREADRTVLPRSEEDEKDYLWGLDRFLGEARTLARFDHPSVVRVQHFFQAHGTGYIVMEHLEGETLGALYGEGATGVDRTWAQRGLVGPAVCLRRIPVRCRVGGSTPNGQALNRISHQWSKRDPCQWQSKIRQLGRELVPPGSVRGRWTRWSCG